MACSTGAEYDGDEYDDPDDSALKELEDAAPLASSVTAGLPYDDDDCDDSETTGLEYEVPSDDSAANEPEEPPNDTWPSYDELDPIWVAVVSNCETSAFRSDRAELISPP